MFQIPVKEIIVNSDTQVKAKNAQGGDYTLTDMATANVKAGLLLEGFLNEIIWASKAIADNTTYTLSNRAGNTSYFAASTGAGKIIKTATYSGAAEAINFTITAANGAQKGDVFRIVTDSLDLTPVQYQNRPTEKRYQLSAYCATQNAVATELAAQITADPNSQVTATAATNVVTITAKKVGVKVGAYVGQQATLGTGGISTAYSVTGAFTVTTAAALPIGTYDSLKNINWAKNFSIDQNINWMPLPGSTYSTYYFEVNSRALSATYANAPYQNEAHNSQIYGIRLYVKSGLTLETALNNADADLLALG